MLRILIAGVLGGIAMFIWSALAHTVLPVGKIGLADLEDEAPVMQALRAGTGDRRGIYVFPDAGFGAETMAEEEAAMAAHMAALKDNPSGMVIYHPPGRSADMARPMAVETGLEIVESIILAYILAHLTFTGLVPRTAAAAAIGFAVAIATHGSYWNWWAFPGNYTLAQIAIQLVGWTLAGFVIALALGFRRRAAGS